MTLDDIKSYLIGRLNSLQNERPKHVEAVQSRDMFESIELQRARYDLIACSNRINEVQMALGAFAPAEQSDNVVEMQAPKETFEA